MKRKHHNPTGAWPSSETPDAPPLAERILNRLKNIRIVAYAIVLGTLLVGFTTLFEAFSKLIAAIPEKQRSVANYDLKTEESALQVARLIDEERHDTQFSLTVKPTLVMGRKVELPLAG